LRPSAPARLHFESDGSGRASWGVQRSGSVIAVDAVAGPGIETASAPQRRAIALQFAGFRVAISRNRIQKPPSGDFVQAFTGKKKRMSVHLIELDGPALELDGR
jgi:hypothetical protein